MTRLRYCSPLGFLTAIVLAIGLCQYASTSARAQPSPEWWKDARTDIPSDVTDEMLVAEILRQPILKYVKPIRVLALQPEKRALDPNSVAGKHLEALIGELRQIAQIDIRLVDEREGADIGLLVSHDEDQGVNWAPNIARRLREIVSGQVGEPILRITWTDGIPAGSFIYANDGRILGSELALNLRHRNRSRTSIESGESLSGYVQAKLRSTLLSHLGYRGRPLPPIRPQPDFAIPPLAYLRILYDGRIKPSMNPTEQIDTIRIVVRERRGR